jgi:transcription antitermination factor NusG
MTHLEMARFQEWFSYVNAQRLRDGLPVIQTFYPYDFLRGRIRDTREAADAKQQKTTVKADAHVEFRRFVFLKATDKDIRDLVYSRENLDSHVRLRRYLDPTGHQALVRDAVMREFFQACLDYRERFELSPSLEGVKALDQVKIISGPYKGFEATVVSVKLVNGKLDLRLAIPMVHGQIDIHRKNVSPKEIVPLNPSDASALRADFIRYTQDSLLDILSARASLLEKSSRRPRPQPSALSPQPSALSPQPSASAASTAQSSALSPQPSVSSVSSASSASPSAAPSAQPSSSSALPFMATSSPSAQLRRHAELLTTLYRYRDYEIQNPSAEAHFTALMLICAHLCQDAKGEKELQQRALQQLEAINAKGPAKASTDTRTYLWIALKISTGDPQYRDLAKDYIRTKQPKSPQLRQFVSLISKKVRL